MIDLTSLDLHKLHAECCDDAGSNKYLDEIVRRAQANKQLQEAAYQTVYQGLTQRDNGVIELQPGEPLRARLILLHKALTAITPMTSPNPTPDPTPAQLHEQIVAKYPNLDQESIKVLICIANNIRDITEKSIEAELTIDIDQVIQTLAAIGVQLIRRGTSLDI